MAEEGDKEGAVSPEPVGVIDKDEEKIEEKKEDKEEEQLGLLGGAFLELGKMMGLAVSEKEKSKKEIQATLKGSDKNNEKVSKDELLSILKLISPGTNFRTALNSIVQGGKGALIVIENENLAPLMDGGFRVNCRFTPQRLFELSKMDGAIILSKDLKKINYANVLLAPDASIKSNETGTRHKSAERTAKQIGGIVVSVSERRHDITLFYKNARQVVKYTAELLRQANEQIQLLEKHRELFDSHLEKLTRAELRNQFNLHHAVNVIQKGRIIQKIAEGTRKSIVELGNEGILLKTRLKELTANVEKEMELVMKDYSKIGLKKSKILVETLNYDEIIDPENIKNALAYEKTIPGKDDSIKGWRILSKTSLIEPDIAMLIKRTGHLGKILNNTQQFYEEALGAEKALQFKEEIERIKLNY
jgi:diadenylate cyclase